MHNGEDKAWAGEDVLIGNAFPMSLVRNHCVTVAEVPLRTVAAAARAGRVHSFWGHENTRAAAEALLGVGLKPAMPRPALALDAAGYPTLDGVRFTTCYVLSPDYRAGFRPAVGEEVADADIRGWHALKLTWRD